MQIFNIHFLNPIFLYIWLFFLFLGIFIIYFKNKRETINIYFLDDLKKIFKISSIYFYIKSLLILSIISIFFILFANPNYINISQKIKQDSIDIVFILDVSKSMEANDLKPIRMELAKNMILKYLDKIKTDRIWLVIFAWKPFSSIPLTNDYDIIKEIINTTTTDSLNQSLEILNWTATWDAILLAKNLFKTKDKKREQVIVLITDGDANKWLDPIIRAKSLKQENIKIYSIWVWTEQGWIIEFKNSFFVQNMHVAPLNDKYLKELSQITAWEYYRASDKKTFEQIFTKLQSLNKNKIEINTNQTFVHNYDIFIYLLLTLFSCLFSLEYFLIKK